MTMNASANGHEKVGRGILLTVFYEGTDTLYQGEPVCYNTDRGTATEADARRANRVERPTAANNKAFAGVAARTYPADSGAGVGGVVSRLIEIYVPGSKSVPVALGVDAVIDTGILTFVVAGRYNVGASYGLKTDCRFGTGKFLGRGSAVPRQTKTAIVEASMTGGWSLATDGVTLTVTDTTGLAAGDTVVLLGGEDDGTGTVIPGKYTIASVTDGTTLVLASSAVDVTPGSAATCTGYAYTGNPTALCDLLDGEESGGIEFLNMPNAGGDNQPYMVGGVSYVCGGVTLAADAECELADGSRPFERKAFHLLGTLTTSDFVVDLVTAGVQLARDTNGALVALAEVNAIDAAGEGCVLQWSGRRWFTVDTLGAAVEA